MSVTHSFTSTKSDGGDATLVKPSDWNAAHIGVVTPTYVRGDSSGDTAVAVANTQIDIAGCTLTLGTGNWMVGAQVLIKNSGGTYVFVQMVAAGTTSIAEMTHPAYAASGGLSGTGATTDTIAPVKVAGSQTVNLKLQSDSTTCIALQKIPGGGGSNSISTFIWAVQVE